MMVIIQENTKVADETKVVVLAEEKEAMQQAIEGSDDKIPTVVLGEYRSSQMLAVVRLEDLLNLLAAAVREPDPLIVVGIDGENL